MTSTLTTLFALFLGTSLFVAGVGLIGTALALRADALGFSGSLTGAVMAAYFAGFVVGTYWCPRIVMRVGHVRAFSALAATSAAAVLLHALWVSPEVWALLRFITGACVVGLYMVIESWLNERSANEVRGRIFAVYQVISLLALALGQYLILWGRENPATAFVVAGALFSIGLVPVVLTRVTQPLPISSVKLDLRALWTISPLGVAGTFAIALANGALFALGPMFAQRVGLSTPQIALFMSLVLLGGVALQWPIGHLSDRWDRRTTILIVSLVGALLAVLAWLLLERHLPSFLVVMFCYGGAAFTLYPLCVAHANDIVPATNFVTIAGGLLLVYGIGAAFGPLLVGALIQGFGAATFLLFLAAMQAGLAVFVLGRMRSRAPPPLEAQEPFVMLARTSQSALEMLAPEDTAPDNTVPADR